MHISILANIRSPIADPAISCTGRNQFRGKIKEIIAGPVVSEVEVETAHGIVSSVISSRSTQDRGLKVGSEVIALVKSTDCKGSIGGRRTPPQSHMRVLHLQA
jgi:molybdopterin-binding protein